MKFRVAITVVCVLLTGCSAFEPYMESVTVTASNDRATIYVDNKRAGVGDVKVELARDRKHKCVATWNREIVSEVIDRQVSPSGQADILGTFLFIFPIVGLGCPGFFELDTTNVQLVFPGDSPRESKYAPPPKPTYLKKSSHR